jgi:hypothetical protein
MKRIPKSLELLGHTITVRVLSKRDWEALVEMNEQIEEDDFGAWFQSDNLILIRRTKRSLMLHTFYHELFHAVLDMMNSPLSNDEALVDNLAGLFGQAMGTAK